jgi:hypothetical protein
MSQIIALLANGFNDYQMSLSTRNSKCNHIYTFSPLKTIIIRENLKNASYFLVLCDSVSENHLDGVNLLSRALMMFSAQSEVFPPICLTSQTVKPSVLWHLSATLWLSIIIIIS